MTDHYDDSAAYSDDDLYRWWWERRWADGPGLCWVGLNPSTGDTTGRPRPTLRNVVALAKAHELSAVTVVNLFSWRATKPADLKRAAVDHDIIGALTDDVIVEVSGHSPITLAAWGSHGSLLGRGVTVAALMIRPMCLGVTASGQPRHPLYVPAGTELRPYGPAGETLGAALERGRDCPVVDAQRWELPDELPLVERQVVRLIVLDTASEVLLFHTHDPTYPELGEWWELPGGGIEDDETYAEAAIRELREETGIAATKAQVDAPTWQRHATFRYRGERRLQHEVVVTVQLSSGAPSVDSALRVGYEDEDYFAYRWWAVDEICSSCERFYPGRLPELISHHLRGETIHEPYEIWS